MYVVSRFVHSSVISIHAPQWGATNRPDGKRGRGMISIHAPQWGATIQPQFVHLPVRISIHAPQWGATGRPPIICLRRRYFNPRTPVGCDRHCRIIPVRRTDFNPRTPVGCDVAAFEAGRWRDISIHAPQWGATSSACSNMVLRVFQSTHPSGVRPLNWQSFRFPRYFNPRTPVGCDSHCRCRRPDEQISIHAPQWGATSPANKAQRTKDISIHAPQWGATLRFIPTAAILRYFNPRTPVGCDRGAPLSHTGRHISIHAPQWGATRAGDCMSRIISISIHAPQWGATHVCAGQQQGGSYFNPRTPVGCD